MSDQAILRVREMSREGLEDLVLQSMMQLRAKRQEAQANESFAGIMIGFIFGALVASSAFSVGALFQ